jgi:hypothetical protein
MSRVVPRLCRLAALALLLVPATAHARVVRVHVDRRVTIAGGAAFGDAGAYERITGRIHFAFDPRNPANRRIVDLDRAPSNAAGEVEAWSEFVMLVPRDPAKRSGVTLVDVVNRGGMTVRVFQLGAQGGAAPDSAAAYGDAFLLRRGYAILMIGWQWDVLPESTGLHFGPPVATGITGLVRSDITVDAPTRAIPLGHRVSTSQALGYPVSDTADAANTLTVRDDPLGARRTIARSAWRFARVDGAGRTIADPRSVVLEGGFEAGRIYEVVYRAKDPVVVGTGLAAVRDVASWLKHDATCLAPTRHVIAYGVSQTGRFLRHFLHEGFNTDERGRAALDGIFAHTAGAGRGSFNHRFAQPSRDAQPYSTFFYPIDLFPFTSPPTRDRGAEVPSRRAGDRVLGGLRHAGAQRSPLPRVFYVDGGYEYWGRAASLTHTTTDGLRDVGFFPGERRYVLSSAQHSSPAGFPPGANARIGDSPAYRGNPMDQRLALRALLVALTDWVATGATPPPSAYPTLRDDMLVRAERRRNPLIPGVAMARLPYQPVRLDFGPGWPRGVIEREPPGLGAPFTVLVPRADSIGNELGGIQSVELRVPVATYFPWQLRATRPLDRLVSFSGTFVPLPKTEAERATRGDSRPSLQALYGSRERFLREVERAADALVAERFLLPDDRAVARERMASSWDWVMSH